MATIEADHAYFLRRAREEARSASAADKPAVAAIHRDLATLYSTRALMAIADGDMPGH